MRHELEWHAAERRLFIFYMSNLLLNCTHALYLCILAGHGRHGVIGVSEMFKVINDAVTAVGTRI